MQLKRRKKAGSARRTLAAASATLLVATGAAAAQDYYGYGQQPRNDNFGPGIAYTQLDSALLVYQESGSRVQATEPSLSLAVHGASGEQLSVDLIADAISGATPNGAVPSDKIQTFLTPLKAQGSSTTVTSASGGSTVIQLPPTPGQVAAAAQGRQYTTTANTLPMDKGFRDHRGALTMGWSQPVGPISEIGISGGYSREQDYQSLTAGLRAAQNFNGANTTLSLALNSEFDTSSPFGGIPAPLTAMSAQWKTPTSREKTQLGFVVGLTQVVTQNWLMQLNYSYDGQSGYETDPYRVISVVDAVSGEPTSTLYESRPGKRQLQSVYWENKFSFGPTLTDISFRYFRDSWHITSKTAEISERINLGRSMYIEPSARWYQQTAANFFQNYLVGGQALPAYASSDPRLAKFTALTYGGKIGFPLSVRTEIYVRGGYYQQTGDGHPASAIGQLRTQDLFAGNKSVFGLFGFQWKFH